MTKQAEKLMQPIIDAVEKANDAIDKVADGIMKTYIDSLNEKYHNHFFQYDCGMGVRHFRVFNKKTGEQIADIDSYGVDYLGNGTVHNRHTPYHDMVEVITDFEYACNTNTYVDAEQTPMIDIVQIRIDADRKARDEIHIYKWEERGEFFQVIKGELHSSPINRNQFMSQYDWKYVRTLTEPELSHLNDVFNTKLKVHVVVR